jgi:branched-chain amino acid transport system substrate-binding protein
MVLNSVHEEERMNKGFKFACLALLAFALVLSSFSGCKEKASGDVVKIGVYQPLTGAYAAGGIDELEGTRIAHEMNPTIQIGGKTYTVELVVVDNRSDRVESANAVQRLIDQDKVHLILGSWGSGQSIPGGEVIKERGIPSIALSATNPLVTLGNDWYFRVCFIDPFQGTVMANYSYRDLGARTAVIVRDITNDYSVGLARFFEQNFIKLAGNPDAILATVDYNVGDQDFTAQLTTIRGRNPDVIFAPGTFTEAALLIRQAREMGMTTPMLGGDTWENDVFLTVGGDRVEGTAFSTFFDDSFTGTDQARIFIGEYKKRNPNKAVPGVAALGYDGYMVALDAIKRADSLEPGKIRDALVTTNFAGATGVTTFDVNGDATKSAFIKEVKNGQFVFKTVVNP